MEVKSNNILIKLQVFAVFQKMGMSLSHRGALNLIDRIGEKHDQRITERRDQIQEQMANDNVYTRNYTVNNKGSKMVHLKLKNL